MKNKIIFLTLITLINCINGISKTIKSLGNGAWTDLNIWENQIIPTQNDTVIINSQHQISIGNQQISVKLIQVFGNINFIHSNAKLNCDSLVAFNNSIITGTATAQINIQSAHILGSSNLGRGNFNFTNLKVNAPLSLNNNTGNVNIENLEILSTGVWNNFINKTCTILNINNQGKMLAGNGKYFLGGSIKTKNLISFNTIEISQNLFNYDSLEVKNQLIGNNFVWTNQNNSYFASSTTVSNFKDVKLNFKAPNNTFVLNRNSFQTIPKPIDNYFDKLIINNSGNANWTDESAYNIEELIVGKNTKLTVKTNIQNQCKKTIIYGEFISNFSSNEKISSHLNHYNFVWEPQSVWTWNSVDTTIINQNFKCSNLNIKSSSSSWIKGKNIQLIINGNLNLHQNVKWITENGKFEIVGSLSGNGVFEDLKSDLIFKNQAKIQITNTQLNNLFFENVDTINFSLNTSASNLNLRNSKLFTRGIFCNEINIDSASQIHVSGILNKIQYINNQGFFNFTGTNGQTEIDLLQNHETGTLNVINGGDFVLKKQIENNGTINGCDGTNCFWRFEKTDTFYILGNGKLFTPRAIANSPLIINYNLWDIAREASGNSTIYNYDTLNIGANSNLFSWEINGKTPQSCLNFNRIGPQNISFQKNTGFSNIGFLNVGRKTLENNIQLNGNMHIQNGCELYLDIFEINNQTSNSNLILSDTSSITIGKINALQSGGFPKGFQHYQLGINSTVRYQSMGNQVITGGINYGNIELNCGAVDSAAFSIQNGIFKYSGNLNLLKSALTLVIEQDSAVFNGHWLGVGNVHLKNTHLHFYGDGLNTGKLWMDNSKVWYKGDKNQRFKIGNYTHVIIDKTQNSKALTRGLLGVLNMEKVWVKKGIFSLQTEETFIKDSLVIWDKVEIGNDIQNKHLNHIQIHKNGIFENTIDENVFFYGNIFNEGSMYLDSGKTIIKGDKTIEWINKGNCTIGKMIIENPSTILQGNFNLNNTIENSKNLKFKNATVYFDSLAFFDSPKYQADENTTFKGEKFLSNGNNFNAWGWGLELQLDSNSFMDKTQFTQKFNPQTLPVKSPLHNYFIIKTPTNKHFNVKMIVDVREDMEEIETYKIIKSIDEGMSFFEVPSSYANQKFIINDIQEFSWWLGAKGGTTVLNIELIDFKITPDFISWKINNNNNSKKYIWQYVNFDLDTFWLAEKSIQHPGKTENFYVNGNFKNGYYQLFEIDENENFQKVNNAFYFLRTYQNDSNYVQVINQELWFNQKADKILCYNIHGQVIDFCENCEFISTQNLKKGVYIFNIHYNHSTINYKLLK